MSEAKLRDLLASVGLTISAGELALLLTQQPGFAAEYEAIGRAGLASSSQHHVAETPTRVNGVTEHCHSRSTPAYTRYQTTPGLDRQAVLDVLRLGAPRRFRLNAVAWAFLEGGRLAARTRRTLEALPQDVTFDEPTFLALLGPIVPATYPARRRFILEGAAIGAYRAQTEGPIVQTLVADGASAWQALTEQLALCWVHEGRHDTQLCPLVAHHRQLLGTVLGEFWAYYRELRVYQQHPTPAEAVRLSTTFDALFCRATGYAALDGCLRRTFARKPNLLLVLDHPAVPLHNNPAELAARRRVRKRDASFGARSAAGIQAWDVFQTILATAKQQGANALHSLQDRLTETYTLPALADLITQRATAHSAAAPAPT